MKTIRYVLMFVAVTFSNAYAANQWGTVWGESFNSVKARFPDAEIVDFTAIDGCSNSTAEHCLKRQVVLARKLADGLPAQVIFDFTSDGKLRTVYVFLAEAKTYSPKRIGIAYDQIRQLLEVEHGKPIGASSFTLLPRPSPYSKGNLDGQGSAVWHTADSIISVEASAIGTESESTPARMTTLFIQYSPLQLITK